MQTHAIVEIEEGALNVTVGGRDGKHVRVQRAVRLPLSELNRDTLTVALRGVSSELLQGATGVHVVLGDRRAQHFASTLPPMGAAAAVQFVLREAARVGNANSGAEVLVATRLLRRQAGGKLVLGSTVLPRAAWEPLAAAFEASGLAVLGLYSMETCLALGAVGHVQNSESVAVVEVNAGRARFVLCDGDCPVQVRRFLIGGGGGGGDSLGAAVTTQLAMELPRTFEWLRETGQPVPATLVLGLRAGDDESAPEMLQSDELKQVLRAKSPVVVAAGQASPGLATATLLARLASGKALPSLLEPPRLVLPLGFVRLATLFTGVAAGLACTASAIVDTTAGMALRSEVQGIAAERAELETADVQPSLPAAPVGEIADVSWLQKAMSMRRPVSRLLADVSDCASADLHVEDLKFASTERLLVVGVVKGASRQQALASIAAFAKRLNDIPYVQTGGDEEIGELPRLPNCFRFRLGMNWRNP